MGKGQGVWIPREIAVCLPRLTLRPPSRWQVFMVVLLTWCRYGCTEARLSIQDICEATGLARRTVQAALAALISLGWSDCAGRQRCLVVIPEALATLVDRSGSTQKSQPTGAALKGHPTGVAPKVHPAGVAPKGQPDSAHGRRLRGADKPAPRSDTCLRLPY